jgi:hypothetical protein
LSHPLQIFAFARLLCHKDSRNTNSLYYRG